MQEKTNPAADGTASGVETNSLAIDGGDSLPEWSIRKAEFFLHVAEDGTEHRLEHEPPPWEHLPTLRVTVENGTETTVTCNIEMWCGAFGEFIEVKPRGARWQLFDASHDKWTKWQRAALGGVP